MLTTCYIQVTNLFKKTYRFKYVIALFLLVISFRSLGANIKSKEEWIENQLQQLSLQEKIGQLFMIASYSNKTEKQYQAIDDLIQQYNIGGVIFFQGDPINQVKLTNRYQQKSKTPLLIALDAEWGLGMRLANTISYPKQMTLGAIEDNELIYKMGVEIARQLQLLGVHINFAPVLDINTNPKNPVIGIRSFGDKPEPVATKALAYIKGMQDNGILAVAKHFPGHGDVSIDSHHDLPVINHTTVRLDSVELYPFKKAIAAHVGGVMVAHVCLPAYDTTANRAVSLSPLIVARLLKEKLGYEGLIFTDALNMKAVSKYYKPGEVELLALQAGNDILLFPEDVPKAIELIKDAIQKGQVDKNTIDEKVRKILAIKYDKNLQNWQPIELVGLCEKLNTPYAIQLKKTLWEKAITVVANQDVLLPITKLSNEKIASLSIVKKPLDTSIAYRNINTKAPTIFSNQLAKYARIDHYVLNRNTLDTTTLQQLTNDLRNYTYVIVDLHKVTGDKGNQFGLQTELLEFLEQLQNEKTKVLLVVFGNVYSLELCKNINHIIAAYQEDPVAEEVVPEIIFGALPAMGTLPISIPNAWEMGRGIKIASIQRLGYSLPESVQISSKKLQEIDNIVEKAILDKAIPGCQILVARKGKIVFEKAYGYHTYEKKIPITTSTLYDIASITKVVGPLQAIMYLVGKKKLHIHKNIASYLPELKNTNKKNITIKSILAHRAGLLDCGIAKNEIFQKDSKLNKILFSTSHSGSYSNKIGEGLYAAPLLKELMWNMYINSKIKRKKLWQPYDYHYNDVSFHILQKLIEKILHQPLEIFLINKFYKPLGISLIGYNPLERTDLQQIAPTEAYDFFRTNSIHGIVHDPKAAICGGVAGSAGIFSNAHNVAVILQMNLQNGYYGGKRYIKEGIISQFTKRAFKNNRRGLGWDKPDIKEKCNISKYASANTYGHLGFTGTAVWVDPDYELIYIILSNRTYPTQTNKKFIEQNIRIKIQDVIYESLEDVKIVQ